MPGRTRSKWASGRVSVAAELARWRRGGSTPARAATSSASPKAAICRPIVGGPGPAGGGEGGDLPADGRVAGLVGVGEVRPDADHGHLAGRLGLRRGDDEVGPGGHVT